MCFLSIITGSKIEKDGSLGENPGQVASLQRMEEDAQENYPKVARAILKNIIIISIAFTFLFTAYNSMANLQSSINE